MTMGQKIAKHRKLYNLTQDQLGDLLGVSRQAISRWESDLAYPETETLIKMSNLFDCSLDYLLKEDEDKENKVPNKTSMTFKDHVTVGDLVVRHWRKIFIPLYISGIVAILIGLILFFGINTLMKPQQSDDFFPSTGGHFSDAQMEMLSSMRTMFTIFGSVMIVAGVIAMIIATILLIKDKKANRKHS